VCALQVAAMIDRRWLPLNALRAFEAAGQHLSFAAAASTLSVSQSTISRHVISLEGLLGVQLFERRPHQLALTDTGAASLNLERFHQGCNRSSLCFTRLLTLIEHESAFGQGE